jgi:SAM-dependent methyltransferase
MDAYSSFAQVYDAFMDNVPYEQGADYIHQILLTQGISDGLLAELGCGTGTLTEQMAGYGYDMIGIDNAPDMLELAQEKRVQSQHDILYLLQDMREFELYGTVRGIISFCDSVNYITEPEERTAVFKLVNNYLDPKGCFIFDFHTPHYYRDELGSSTIAEDREDMSFIWDNYYDDASGIHEYLLSLFIEEESGLYRKYQEEHFQRGYELEEIKAMLSSAGLTFLAAYDEFSFDAPNAHSTRIHVVAQECGKQI